MFELIDGAHQTGVPFLDKVQEAEAAVAVLFGDGDDQAKVTRRQELLGGVILALEKAGAMNAMFQCSGAIQRAISDLCLSLEFTCL